MQRFWGVVLLALAAALAAPPGVSIGRPLPGDETYTGANLRKDLGERGQIVIESLELNEADISDVVRLLARIAGINIITGDLRGSITVYLENVTVQSALEAILSSQGYGFIFDGNIVRVVDASRLGEDKVETITETFPLNYLPAESVATNLRKVFSGGGSGSNLNKIEANVEANAIIAVDIPKRMEDIRRLIKILDQRNEQVEIEGRFVEISFNQDQSYGVDWKYFQDPANTLDVNLSPEPLNASNVAGQFKFAIINGRDNLTGFLQALETNNDVKILADPKILALENKQATIELIDEIPFVEANISQGVITESVQFQETGIRLVVTPQIAEEPDGTFVRMKLELEQRIAGPNVILQNSVAFPIDSRRALSELIVPDDATVIIGGLRSSDLKYTYEKIPILGNIPLLGAAFRKRVKGDDQKELLLFVTPRVIYDHPPLDGKEQELHDDIDKVVDGLETQAEWRDNAEAPFETFEKGILYSGVNTKPQKYEKVQRAKNALENVKPYKVSKPKGKSRYRISVDGKNVREEEIPVDQQSPEMVPVDEPAAPPPGEVKDFKKIEKEAKPGTGSSGAGWNNPDRQAEEAPAPIPIQAVPGFAPEDGAEQSQPAPESEEGAPDKDKSQEDAPSWLRRAGRQSDAGSALDSIEEEISDPAIEESYLAATTLSTAPPEEPPADTPAEPVPPVHLKREVEEMAAAPVPEPEPAEPPQVREPEEPPVVKAPAAQAPVQTNPPSEPAVSASTPLVGAEIPVAESQPAPRQKNESAAEPDPWSLPKMAAAISPPEPPPLPEPPAVKEEPRAPAPVAAAQLLLNAEAAARQRQKVANSGHKTTAHATAPQVPEIQVLAAPLAPKRQAPKKSEPIDRVPVSMAPPEEPPVPLIPAKPAAASAPPASPILPPPPAGAEPDPWMLNSHSTTDARKAPKPAATVVPVIDLRKTVEAHTTNPRLKDFLDPDALTALAEAERLERFGSEYADLRRPELDDNPGQSPLPEEAFNSIAVCNFLSNSPNPRPILLAEESTSTPASSPPIKDLLDTGSTIAYNNETSDKNGQPDKSAKDSGWWNRWLGTK